MAATDAGKTNKPYTLAQVNPQISISCVSSEKGMGRERERDLRLCTVINVYTVCCKPVFYAHVHRRRTYVYDLSIPAFQRLDKT